MQSVVPIKVAENELERRMKPQNTLNTLKKNIE